MENNFGAEHSGNVNMKALARFYGRKLFPPKQSTCRKRKMNRIVERNCTSEVAFGSCAIMEWSSAETKQNFQMS